MEVEFSIKKRVVLACDHAGYPMMQDIKLFLSDCGAELIDLGTNSLDSVDYPDFGAAAAEAIADGRAEMGVIVCGSGIGISIAANRNPAARAALCQSGLMAKLSRQHNDANILALGARLIGIETAKDCIIQFFSTDFEGGRHKKRVDKLANPS